MSQKAATRAWGRSSDIAKGWGGGGEITQGHSCPQTRSGRSPPQGPRGSLPSPTPQVKGVWVLSQPGGQPPASPPGPSPQPAQTPSEPAMGRCTLLGGNTGRGAVGPAPTPASPPPPAPHPPPPRPQPEPLGNRGRSFNLPQTAGWGPFPAGKGRHSLAIPSQSPGSEAGERFLLQTAARRGPASPPPRRSPPDEGRREGPGK